jgi:uncharacterized protein YyaL (SSP411 family)
MAERAAQLYATGGAALAAQLGRFARSDDAPASSIDPMLVENTVRALTATADLSYGGFGANQKFPDAPAVQLLLAVGERDLARQALDGILRLEDRVAGGFFRYATERDWSHPHYEKMLAGNAELLTLFAHAGVLYDEPRYREAALRTAKWLRATLFDEKSGALSASQDADEHYYALDAAARAKTTAPYIDRTLLADRACLAIASLATAGRELHHPELADFARRAWRAIPNPLVHARGVPAQLGDYAECALAALAVDDRARARALVAAAATLRAPDGGYYDANVKPPLMTRRRPPVDNAHLALAQAQLGDQAAARKTLASVAFVMPEIALALLTIDR